MDVDVDECLGRRRGGGGGWGFEDIASVIMWRW